jgi:hypothetical protein
MTDKRKCSLQEVVGWSVKLKVFLRVWSTLKAFTIHGFISMFCVDTNRNAEQFLSSNARRITSAIFSKKKEGSGTHRLTGRRQELVKPIPGKEASGTPFRVVFFWEITYGTVFRHETTPAYNKTRSISARETSCSWENEVLGPCLLTGTVNKLLLTMYSTGFLEIVPVPPRLQCYSVKEQIWANDVLHQEYAIVLHSLLQDLRARHIIM